MRRISWVIGSILVLYLGSTHAFAEAQSEYEVALERANTVLTQREQPLVSSVQSRAKTDASQSFCFGSQITPAQIESFNPILQKIDEQWFSQPQSTLEAAHALRRECKPGSTRHFELLREQEYESLYFVCEQSEQKDAPAAVQTYLIKVDAQNELKSFERVEATSSFRRVGPFVVGTVALGASVLLANQSAQMTFPGERDKRLHAMAGSMIGAIGTGVGLKVFKRSKLESFLVGAVASSLAGVGKEIWDRKTHGDVSRQDIYATMEGGVLGAVSGLTLSVRF